MWRRALKGLFFGVCMSLIRNEVSAADSQNINDASAVVELTSSTYDLYVSNESKWLIEMYAPWCGHCQRLIPEFEKAAQSLHEIQSSVRLGKVDCTKQRDLCNKFDVRGYPTIKFVTGKDKSISYGGLRIASAIVEFCKKMEGPTFSYVSRPEEMEMFMAQYPKLEFMRTIFFIGVRDRDTALPTPIVNIAERLKDRHDFVIVSGEDVAENFGMKISTDENAITLWAVGTGVLTIPFEGNIDSENDVEEWILSHRFPTVVPLSGDNFTQVMQTKRPVVILAYPGSDHQRTEKLFTEMATAAKSDRHSFIYGMIDGEVFASELSHFDLSASNLPKLVVVDPSSEKLFSDDELLNVDDITSGLQRVKKGLIKPKYPGQSAFKKNARFIAEVAKSISIWASQSTANVFLLVACAVIIATGFLITCWSCFSWLTKENKAMRDINQYNQLQTAFNQNKATENKIEDVTEQYEQETKKAK